jgi:hypothetical protein
VHQLTQSGPHPHDLGVGVLHARGRHRIVQARAPREHRAERRLDGPAHLLAHVRERPDHLRIGAAHVDETPEGPFTGPRPIDTQAPPDTPVERRFTDEQRPAALRRFKQRPWSVSQQNPLSAVVFSAERYGG